MIYQAKTAGGLSRLLQDYDLEKVKGYVKKRNGIWTWRRALSSSEQAKESGFKSIKHLAEIANIDYNTLRRLAYRHPGKFTVVIENYKNKGELI